MPKIIALAGQKGGSGKTTTALCIADEFFRRGKRVLLVDLDPQGTALTALSVAQRNDHDGPHGVGMRPGFHRTIESVAEGYDVVVLDCPPGQGEMQRAAFMVADVAIIPSGPSAADIWSLVGTFQLLSEAKAFRPELFAGVLLTRKDARTQLGELAHETIEEASLPILESSLGLRVAYQECIGAGLGVTRYAPTSEAAKEVKQLVNEIDSARGAVRRVS